MVFQIERRNGFIPTAKTKKTPTSNEKGRSEF